DRLGAACQQIGDAKLRGDLDRLRELELRDHLKEGQGRWCGIDAHRLLAAQNKKANRLRLIRLISVRDRACGALPRPSSGCSIGRSIPYSAPLLARCRVEPSGAALP